MNSRDRAPVHRAATDKADCLLDINDVNWRIVKSHGKEGDMIALFDNNNLLLRKRLVRQEVTDELESDDKGVNVVLGLIKKTIEGMAQRGETDELGIDNDDYDKDNEG